MNAVETLLTQPIFQAVGWALIHFIWQGALVALLLCAVVALPLRRASANARYVVSCAALVLMLALPVVTALYINENSNPRASALTQNANAPADATTDRSDAAVATAATKVSYLYTALVWPVASETWRPGEWFALLLPWLVSVWLAGVLSLSLRVLGGWAITQRLARRALNAPTRAMQETLERLAARLRVSRPVRLCESLAVEVPTVIGWLRPVILLPVSALAGLSAQQLEALLAHELAHIRRHDYLVNMLQTAVETLLFYHPAVWWVSRQIRAERENCCDDLAVAACGDVLTYARALAELEQLRGDTPQLAVAADGGGGGLLMRRIRRLIEVPPPPAHRASAWLASVIVLATVFSIWAGARTTVLLKTTAAQLLSDARAEVSSGAPQDETNEPRASKDASAGEGGSQSEDAEADAPDDRIVETDLRRDFGASFDKQISADVNADLRADAALVAQDKQKNEDKDKAKDKDDDDAQDAAEATADAGDDLSAAGYAKLSDDDLNAFRIHGVTGDFIRELRSLGYQHLSPETLVAFRIHGVTPDFIRGWNAQGQRNLPADQLVAFRIHGVTSEFVRDIKPLVSGNVSLDDLVAFRIHGVNAAFIEEMRNAGMRNLSADDLTAMRIHGVNAAFVRAVEAEGFDLSPEDAIALRIHGVTPEFIRQVKSRNFRDLTIEQLITLRRLGVIK